MQTDRIAGIRERLKAATPGPWGMDAESYIVNSGEEMICADLRTEGDAEFIAHAREDMQCLLSSLGSCDAILAAVLDLCEATDTETNEPLQGWLVDSIRAALASGKD